MLAVDLSPTVANAAQIPYVTADEAFTLMQTELDRFLALVETLDPDDWNKPTACTAWNVRDMLAHQAGGYASGTSYREMFHQYLHLPRKGQLPEDRINEIQLADRAGRSPAELIAELRQVGPIAIQKWAYQFRLVKWIAAPHPAAGISSLGYLMWIIHSRDTWMHRLDICRATGRHFEQTAAHDGRIAALVVRDVAKKLSKIMAGRAIRFDLSGIAGGVWQIGEGEPATTIQMDVLDFNIYASGRYTYDQARPRATILGDIPFAELALKNTVALY